MTKTNQARTKGGAVACATSVCQDSIDNQFLHAIITPDNEPLEDIINEAKKVALSVSVPSITSRVNDTILDFSNYDEEAPILDFSEPLFYIDKLPIMGGLVLVTANQKSGKSQFINICAIKALLDAQKFDVVLIDTEQARASVELRFRIIREAVGVENAKRLKVCNFKQFKETAEGLANESIEYIKALGENFTANTIVLIDGIRDFVESINSEVQADALLTALRCIADKKGCTFLSVLHFNKRTDVERGFLGSEAINKVDQTIRVINRDSDTNASITKAQKNKMESCGYQFYAVCGSGAKDYDLPTSGDCRHNGGGAMAWNIDTLSGKSYNTINHRTGEKGVKNIPVYKIAILDKTDKTKEQEQREAEEQEREEQRQRLEELYHVSELPDEGLSFRKKQGTNEMNDTCEAYKWIEGHANEIAISEADATAIIYEMQRLGMIKIINKQHQLFKA